MRVPLLRPALATRLKPMSTGVRRAGSVFQKFWSLLGGKEWRKKRDSAGASKDLHNHREPLLLRPQLYRHLGGEISSSISGIGQCLARKLERGRRKQDPHRIRARQRWSQGPGFQSCNLTLIVVQVGTSFWVDVIRGKRTKPSSVHSIF